MVSKEKLIKNIKSEFPRLRNPKDYANVILEGVKLKAFNSNSSKKRRDFLKSGKVKEHIFSNSYQKWNLLVSIREADRIMVLASARAGLLFNFSIARRILSREKDLLFAHLDSEPHIRRFIATPLKLSSTALPNAIKNRMDLGDLIKQAVNYEKVYRNLIRNGIKPKGYMWFGVRTIPVSHYYLSNKSKQLLVKG